MTQTPRDWQKDMEMCDAATPGPWKARSWTVPTADQYNITSEHDASEIFTAWQGTRYPGGPEVSADQAKLNAIVAAEARTALPYWLQEAKIYKQSYEGTLSAWEAEKARADVAELEASKYQTLLDEAHTQGKVWIDEARNIEIQWEDEWKRANRAEAREQRMKEVVEDTIIEPELWTDPKNGLEVVIRCLKDVLSTLYPDTPTPKEGE